MDIPKGPERHGSPLEPSYVPGSGSFNHKRSSKAKNVRNAHYGQLNRHTIDNRHLKLARAYSESEKNNFDDVTGHRMYDDGKIRPKLSRSNTQSDSGELTDDEYSSKIFAKSHRHIPKISESPFVGIEDEYIPDLDFGNLIYKWNKPSEHDLLDRYNSKDSVPSNNTSSSNTPSTSYLDLQSLHAQVAPQPIRSNRQSAPKMYSKLSEVMRLRGNEVSEASTESKKPKKKSAVNSETGEIDYEFILNSLPPNFTDLPYSQRKKLVRSFADSVDYSHFSQFARQFFSEKASSTSSRTPKSMNSFKRQRRDSSGTVAGRLLAISSSTDLSNRNTPEPPKVNVDEKGAFVLGYELGKIIGFGAWGTIRECKDSDSNVKAIKIVKSYRDNITNEYGEVKHNPKVLEVFRKEIEIWKQLHHPNILPLFDVLETEDITFCVTERISGGTLFELVSHWGYYLPSAHPEHLLSKQATRISRSMSYVEQIVDALSYMHGQMGMVHGDIKLENVLVRDEGKDGFRMILCDFGMSRVYTSRFSRKSSRRNDFDSVRSRSSAAQLRRPYQDYGIQAQHIFNDDSKVGISNFSRPHGPSLQSLDLTPVQSDLSLTKFNDPSIGETNEGIESELPHSHIGSLPYASPEILLPSPPPLGPSADIWALGVLTYTIIVGKLVFQHQYEPRLRAMIAAGKYNKPELRKACLIEWLFEDGELGDKKTGSKTSLASINPGMGEDHFQKLKYQWDSHDTKEYQWVYDIITGCLEPDITKRLDIENINRFFLKQGSSNESSLTTI